MFERMIVYWQSPGSPGWEISNESHSKKAYCDSLGPSRHSGGCLRGSYPENKRSRQRRTGVAERGELAQRIACGGRLRAGEQAETGRPVGSDGQLIRN